MRVRYFASVICSFLLFFSWGDFSLMKFYAYWLDDMDIYPMFGYDLLCYHIHNYCYWCCYFYYKCYYCCSFMLLYYCINILLLLIILLFHYYYVIFRMLSKERTSIIYLIQNSFTGGKEESVRMKQIDEYTFEYVYHPWKEGRYIVMVTYGGEEIPKSPFEVRIIKKQESFCFVFWKPCQLE